MSTKPIRGTRLDIGHRLSRGMVLYYLLNEGTGGNVFDSSLNGNHGTINGAIWDVDTVGSVLDFSSDYIRITDKPSIEPTRITIGALIKPDSRPSYAKIVSKDYRGDGSWADPWVSYTLSPSHSTTGKPSIDITTGGVLTTVTSPDALTNGVWYYIVGTYDGAEIKIYVNGVEKNSANKTGDIDYSGGATQDLVIGTRSPYNLGEYFDGMGGLVYIINRALLAQEIALLYQEPYAMFL